MWPKSLIKRNFLTKEHLELLKNIEWNTPDTGWDILTPQLVDGKFHDLMFRSLPEGTQSPIPSNIPTAENFVDMYNTYQPMMLAALRRLAPEKIKYHIWTELQVVCTGKDFKFRIHNDSTSKLLSTVVYIAPDQNIGTILYDDEEGTNPREIDWEPNKGFIFSRTEDTWHSYMSDGISRRLTLVYTLRG